MKFNKKHFHTQSGGGDESRNDCVIKPEYHALLPGYQSVWVMRLKIGYAVQLVKLSNMESFIDATQWF